VLVRQEKGRVVGKKGSVARGSERAFLVSKERRAGVFV